MVPEVSVIMPTCNRAKLVERSIRSVLCQSFKNFEFIIIDDGSTDGTDIVIATIADKRIRYFRNSSSKGGSQARNIGIERAKGKYIAFIDDDDSWDEAKLDLQVKAAKNTQADLIYTGCRYVDQTSGEVIKSRVPSRRGDLFSDLLTANHVGPTSTVLLTREIIERAGAFDPDLPSCQDWDLWLRVARIGQIDFLRESLATIYVHSHRISSDIGKKLTARQRLFLKIAPDLQQDPRALAQFYFRYGHLYALQGELAKSRAEIRQAIAIDWKRPEFYLLLLCISFGRWVFNSVRGMRWRGIRARIPWLQEN